MTATPAATYDIDGQTVTLPVEVRDASSGFATFLVPRDAAAALLPAPGLVPVTVLPRRTLLGIGVIDYRDNDLGRYHEVAVLLFVRPAGRRGGGLPATLRGLARGTLGTCIWQLPVDQDFTLKAGRRIWGFPKWRADIHIEHTDDRWRGRLVQQGQHVLTLDVPAVGTRSMPAADTSTYTLIDGRWHRTALRQQARVLGFRLGGGSLELGGAHPVARTLRGLGLPRRPVGTLWLDGLHSTFEAPVPL